jgi:hypothetical protein
LPGRRGSGRDGGRDRLTVFDDARLAGIYDALDPDRSDLGAYLAIVEEIGARPVLDLGCGTGVFALMLADHGVAERLRGRWHGHHLAIDPALPLALGSRGVAAGNGIRRRRRP